MDIRPPLPLACLGTLAAIAACATPSPPGPLTPAQLHGQALAQRLCANCHAVDRTDRSRDDHAIPFRTLSTLYPVADIEEALVEGLMSGHPDMPEFVFTEEAAQDLIAYLESIQTAPRRAID